ncbi:unnamed protein product, partial [Polarella glacialis]
LAPAEGQTPKALDAEQEPSPSTPSSPRCGARRLAAGLAPAEITTLQSGGPGVYVVTQKVSLTTGSAKASPRIEWLSAGTHVQVLEVQCRLEDNRVRGRIEEPAGWISLASLEDISNRWAVMDLEKSNRWIVGGVERLKELTRNLEAAEQVTKEMQEAATAKLSELYQREAEVAEELVQSQSESHDLRDRCVQHESARRDAKLALKAVCLQVDSPGVYCLSSSVDVTEGPARGSPKCERLATDTVVHVVEVVHRLQERRVRGRIESPAGWISLLDIDEGSRWADKQLDASNEWIAQIPSAGSIAAGGLEGCQRHAASRKEQQKPSVPSSTEGAAPIELNPGASAASASDFGLSYAGDQP